MKKLVLLVLSCIMFAAGCGTLPFLGGQTSASSSVTTQSSYSSYIDSQSIEPESISFESSLSANSEVESSSFEESSFENSEAESSSFEESSFESSEEESSEVEEASSEEVWTESSEVESVSSEEITVDSSGVESVSSEESTVDSSEAESDSSEEITVDSSEDESVSSEEITVDSSEAESSSFEESTVDSSEAESDSFEESRVDSSEAESVSSEESDLESSKIESNEPESSELESSKPESSEEESSESESSEEESSEITHTYHPVVVLPTCKEDGYTIYICSICEDSFKTDVVPSTGHSYKGVKTLPTCEKDGFTTYTCLVCEDWYEADVVPATGHNWAAATTLAPKTCKTCGATEGEKLPSTSYRDTLCVNYIDVGQGDSIFIKVDDCDILIDGGVAAQGTTVSKYLKNQGVDDVELMINTHPDADHCGGLTQVLKDFKVEELWAPSRTATSATYKNFASVVKSEGLTAKTPSVGEVYTYEYLTVTVLYNGNGTSSSNDSSIVVMVEYGSFRFLFTGDISSTIENQLASNSNISLKCDVLKVAHHGSRYSSSSTFLRATGAKYGVICVGTDNSYGHPTSTALNNLKSAGISVYRTDISGHIVFSTNGETMQLPGGGGKVSGDSAAFVAEESGYSSSFLSSKLSIDSLSSSYIAMKSRKTASFWKKKGL